MSLWGKIADLIRRDAKKLMYVSIPAKHTDVQFDEAVIQAGKHYFRLWLAEMHLKRDRDWFKSWYPVTHTLVRFQFGEQQVEIPNVAGPLKLNGVNAGNLENVVKLNYAMTTLMPFRGGTVEIMAGLLAMKGKDYLQAFLGVMESFADLLVVPQLSAALKVAGPVANGVEKLIGATDGELHLGLHQTLQSQPGGSNLLRPGYIAVIRAEENEVDANKLWIVDDRLRYGNDAASSQPFKLFPHIVFRIEKQTERDDWDALTSIAEPRAEMVKALIKGDKESAKGYKVAAQMAALLSPDLTTDHKKLVFYQLQKELDEFPAFERLDAESEATPQLSLSWAMKNAVAEDIQTLQLPNVEEFLRVALSGEQTGGRESYTEIDSQVREADDIPKQEETPNRGDDIFAEPEVEDVSDEEGIGEETFALRAASTTRWRVAKSLLALRDQVNRKAPRRNKDSDGTIGDAAHQGRESDHNPWVRDGGIGVVTAMDITHDPNDGCDANTIAEALRASRDARVKYIIFNRRIANSSPIGSARAWEWRPYVGPKKNPHTQHIHISVKSNKGNYDSTSPWPI